MSKLVFIIILIFNYCLVLNAQNEADKKTISNKLHAIDISLGVGYVYGGTIGSSVAFFPIRYASLFFSAGFSENITLINTGIQLNLDEHSEKSSLRPHLKLLYGTNATCYYSKPGTSIIIGFEIRINRKKNHGFDVDLAIPASKVDNKKSLRTFYQFSIGYHAEF